MYVVTWSFIEDKCWNKFSSVTIGVSQAASVPYFFETRPPRPELEMNGIVMRND